MLANISFKKNSYQGNNPYFKANKTKEEKETRLSIFYVNDFHGKVKAMSPLKIAADNFTKFHKRREKQTGLQTDLFKLAGGDMKVGMNGKSNLLALLWMNMLGFELSSLGNHELDCGPVRFSNQLDELNKNADKYLKDIENGRNLTEFNMHFVASNLRLDPENPMTKHFGDFLKIVDDKPIKAEDNKRIVKSCIIEKNGHKYGFVGAVPIKLDIKVKVFDDLDLVLKKIKKIDKSGELKEFTKDVKNLIKALKTGSEKEINKELSNISKTANELKSRLKNNKQLTGFINKTMKEIAECRKNGVYSINSRKDNIKVIQSAVDKLEKQGVNKIILLSHAGIFEETKIAKETHGIDIILGGHSHSYIKNVYKSNSGQPVMVIQAGRNGDSYVLLDAVFDKDGVLKANIEKNSTNSDANKLGKISHNDIRIKKTNKIVQQEEPRVEQLMTDILGEKKEKIDELKDPYISIRERKKEELKNEGKTTESFSQIDAAADARARNCENPLASFTADALRRESQKFGINADVVLLTNGYDLLTQNFKAGDITNRDILNFLPFRNNIYKLKLTGKELKEIILWGANSVQTKVGKPGLIQVSGLKYTTTPFGKEKIRDLQIENSKGKYVNLELKKEYNVLLDDYFFSSVSYSGNKEILELLKSKKNELLPDLHKKASIVDYIKSFKGKPFVINNDPLNGKTADRIKVIK